MVLVGHGHLLVGVVTLRIHLTYLSYLSILQKIVYTNWSEVDTTINKYLINLIDKIIGDFRVSFLVKSDVFNLENIDPNDQFSYHKETLRVANEVIVTNISSKIRGFKRPNWEYLDQHFHDSNEEIKNFLNMYHNRLNPKQISLLFKIKDHFSVGLGLYNLVPEVFGASEEDFPEFSKFSWATINKSIESTSDSIKEIITLANSLSLTCRYELK